jgi:lysophospholipase L1-like esterase
MNLFRRSIFSAAVAVTAGLLSFGMGARPAHADGLYLALGDSYAFGYTSFATTPPSNGDQGYVSQFATFLGQRDGGGRPTVLNLARPGETSDSFFTSTISPTTPPFNFNTNYAAGGYSQSQSQLLASLVPGSAGVPRYITLQIGGNDLLDIIGAPGFSSLPLLQQQMQIAAGFSTLQTNYAAILTNLRTIAPSAEIYLLGYPDPFMGLDGVAPTNPLFPTNPFGPLSTLLAVQTNTLIQNLAAQPAFNARYVDIYTPFVGNEKALTNITTNDITGLPNYHPNAAGYNVISQRVIAAASAPEPGTLVLVGLGLFGGVAVVARRRGQ